MDRVPIVGMQTLSGCHLGGQRRAQHDEQSASSCQQSHSTWTTLSAAIESHHQGNPACCYRQKQDSQENGLLRNKYSNIGFITERLRGGSDY